MQPKAIQLNGIPLAGGQLPAVCAPLVGRTSAHLLAEVTQVAAKRPDLLEWRVDFFQGLADTQRVLELAGRLKQAAQGIPILFTRRAQREGGQPIELDEARVVDVYRAVCESGHVDLIDFEMNNDANHVRELRDLSRRCGVQLILSYHNFTETPPTAALLDRFAQAEQLGADVAKVAVMPRSTDDLLTLLGATLQASRERGIPLVSMSMGGEGALTRLCGWIFGSALTFAVGADSSAPGQMPIEEVRTGLALLRKAMQIRT